MDGRQFLRAKPRPDASRIDQRVAVVPSDVERPEARTRSFGRGEPYHHEVIGFVGADFHPVAGSPGPVRSIGPLSHDALQPELHRLREEGLALPLHVIGVCRTPPTIIAGLFEKNAYGEGKARWGDKTPYYVLHLPKIVQWFPGAQFIHLIRDGRDCSLSLINRKHDFSVYNTYQAAKYWQRYVQVGREHGKRLGPDTYVEIRYEDLLADPKGTMLQICAFLGEQYTESLVHYNKANQAGKTPLLQKPVQPDNAGKWRSQMSHASIRAFESVAADTLAQSGYPVETGTRALPWVMQVAFRAHNRLMSFVNRSIFRSILRRR